MGEYDKNSYDSIITDITGKIDFLKQTLMNELESQNAELAEIRRQTTRTNGRVTSHDRLLEMFGESVDKIGKRLKETNERLNSFSEQITPILWLRANWRTTLAIVIPLLSFLGWGLREGWIQIHPGGYNETLLVPNKVEHHSALPEAPHRVSGPPVGSVLHSRIGVGDPDSALAASAVAGARP